jgi:hypothetical protein
MITLDAADPRVTDATWLSAAILRVGAAMARLAIFTQNGAEQDTFLADPATFAAIRKAAATLTDVPRDVTTTYDKYRVPDATRKSGWAPWARVTKATKVPKDAEKGIGTITTHSGKAQREGVLRMEKLGIVIEQDDVKHDQDGVTYTLTRFRRAPVVTDTDN